METQSVRIDKALLAKVKKNIGKSKLPVSSWINTAITNELKAKATEKRIMKTFKDSGRDSFYAGDNC